MPTRTSEYDLGYAIQQLVDVAEHAMTPSSLDTSIAYEALMHLRAVFNRLLEMAPLAEQRPRLDQAVNAAVGTASGDGP